MGERPDLRPGVNVADEMERDRLVKRLRKIRADAVLHKNTCEHWNAAHQEAEPLDAIFWDAIIAWCDGRGPLPQAAGGPPPTEGGEPADG